jgi:arylsulfatase
VLLVTFDHWPAKLLGAAGHPVIESRALDQLARNGTRFSRAYSECPICIPARRTLMTGTTTRTHGDRAFNPGAPMPDLPTLAGTFREAGYQTYAVGKLHVYPPRDRIGFDDALIAEEGRPKLGGIDDYDIFLADRGFPGRQFMHGMNNSDYVFRSWHLPEECHVTNWTTEQMARAIKRRDPTRPAFWYLSYTHPHPPVAPLQTYLDYYRQQEVDPPLEADWARDEQALPFALQVNRDYWPSFTPGQIRELRRAFYALCTHIDHQLRIVIGTLREEGLLDDTILMLTSDHGDTLGDFGLFAKRTYYEGSANVPMIVVGTARDDRVGQRRVDDRLVGLQDVMPTLLDLAGIPVPSSVEGRSMFGTERRATLYGDCMEDAVATRMLHDGRHKLIWYPVGNHVQLFDLAEDPCELVDLADHPGYREVRRGLEQALVGQLWGVDEAWTKDGRLVGTAARVYEPKPNRHIFAQRGLHHPQPPIDRPETAVHGFPEL